LLVDDEVLLARGLAEGLEQMGFVCRVAVGGREALRMMGECHPEVMVIDVRMPGMDGIEVLKKAQAADPDIGVVMLTGLNERRIAVEALKLGASDYLLKPVRLRKLSESIDEALERRRLVEEDRECQADLERKVVRRTRELEEAYEATVAGLLVALDLRQGQSSSHSERVTRYALGVAGKVGLDEAALEAIRLGGPLHDVGMIGVPDAILLKPEPLSDEEMAQVRRHPELGYKIVAKVDNLSGALPIVLYHHERWDGTGYPDGLSGEEIPLIARIFAVADAYDSMISDRPHRKAMDKREAVAELRAGAGSRFDPAVVEAMVEVLHGGSELWEGVDRKHGVELEG
jgi:response regulator RpfG family c-di-GMP phosphodiesterase